MKRFTVEQAEALIPQLEKIFEAVGRLAVKAQKKADEVRALEENESHVPVELALARSQVQFLTQQIEARLHEILDLGAMPKGLDPALVDFPARVGGHDVFLCWTAGEKSITAYHGVDEGFSARRSLPKRRA
jgi:hypothetical protein